jgi:hypothetical protein
MNWTVVKRSQMTNKYIFCHKGNSNQNYFEIHLTLSELLLSSRKQKTNAGEDKGGGKGSLIHYWWECNLSVATMEISMKVPQKTENRTIL